MLGAFAESHQHEANPMPLGHALVIRSIVLQQPAARLRILAVSYAVSATRGTREAHAQTGPYTLYHTPNNSCTLPPVYNAAKRYRRLHGHPALPFTPLANRRRQRHTTYSRQQEERLGPNASQRQGRHNQRRQQPKPKDSEP